MGGRHLTNCNITPVQILFVSLFISEGEFLDQPSVTHLHLVMCSGLTPGDVHESMYGAGARKQVYVTCKASMLILTLLITPWSRNKIKKLRRNKRSCIFASTIIVLWLLLLFLIVEQSFFGTPVHHLNIRYLGKGRVPPT